MSKILLTLFILFLSSQSAFVLANDAYTLDVQNNTPSDMKISLNTGNSGTTNISMSPSSGNSYTINSGDPANITFTCVQDSWPGGDYLAGVVACGAHIDVFYQENGNWIENAYIDVSLSCQESLGTSSPVFSYGWGIVAHQGDGTNKYPINLNCEAYAPSGAGTGGCEWPGPGRCSINFR